MCFNDFTWLLETKKFGIRLYKNDNFHEKVLLIAVSEHFFDFYFGVSFFKYF